MNRSKFRSHTAAALAASLTLLFSDQASAIIVRFQTSVGDVDVRLYNTATPNSVTNFLNYVTTNRYDGSFIHRVPQVPSGGSSNFVVQGGGFLLNNSIFAASAISTDPPISDEPHISNTRGTLAAAKSALGATSQWYFNIGNNSFLDSSDFSPFGRVLGNGMTVVDAINSLPTVNAVAAQNAVGEDFDEIPVRDINQVFSQNDITANEAVMVSLSVRNLPAGDYDFNGVVDEADLNVWQTTLGSTLNAAADGNGDGIVNQPDYDIWLSGVPEPSTAILTASALLASLGLKHRHRRTKPI